MAVNNTPQAASGAPQAGASESPVEGRRFRELLCAGQTWLERHHEIVNALNVFPVPDGDTGTNMLLTMKSACREITDERIESVGEVAKADFIVSSMFVPVSPSGTGNTFSAFTIS